MRLIRLQKVHIPVSCIICYLGVVVDPSELNFLIGGLTSEELRIGLSDKGAACQRPNGWPIGHAL
jgi:hypothetical protein